MSGNDEVRVGALLVDQTIFIVVAAGADTEPVTAHRSAQIVSEVLFLFSSQSQVKSPIAAPVKNIEVSVLSVLYARDSLIPLL